MTSNQEVVSSNPSCAIFKDADDNILQYERRVLKEKRDQRSSFRRNKNCVYCNMPKKSTCHIKVKLFCFLLKQFFENVKKKKFTVGGF